MPDMTMVASGATPAPAVVNRGRWTVLSNGETAVLYDGASLAVSAIDFPSNPPSDGDIRELLNSLEPNYKTASNNKTVFLPVTRLPEVTPPFSPLVDGKSGFVSRLTVNIANACNLWCSYCYADHGNYHSPSSLMPPAEAVAVVKKCLSLYAGVSMVHFFGGEPLLNPGAMRATCDYLKSALGPGSPRFVATTNGTILTAELESLLVENQIALTISVDGPAVIHDRLRPTRDQSSSHEVLCRNVERLRELGVPIDFECTYTLAHYHAGVSVSSLLDYFSEELGEDHPHIAWSYLPRPLARTAGDRFGIFRTDFESQVRQHLPVELLTSQFRDAARTSMENIERGSGAVLSFVTRVLDHLTTRRGADSYCPAFTSQLSIATDGTAYPCFMFIGDPRMKLGNIFHDTFPTQNAAAVWRRYQEGFADSVTGSQNWYGGLLSGCVAGEYIATGTMTERIYEPVQQAIIEQVLLGIVRCCPNPGSDNQGAERNNG
jgi:uncharacterized protein